MNHFFRIYFYVILNIFLWFVLFSWYSFCGFDFIIVLSASGLWLMFPQRIEFNGELSSHFGIASIGSISMYTSVLHSVQVCLFLCHKNPFGAFHLIADRFERSIVECLLFSTSLSYFRFMKMSMNIFFWMLSIVCLALCNKKIKTFFLNTHHIHSQTLCKKMTNIIRFCWQSFNISTSSPLSHGAYINSLSNAQNKRRDKKVKLTNEWFVQRRMFMVNKKNLRKNEHIRK